MPVQEQKQLDPWGVVSTASDPWPPVNGLPKTSPQPNLVPASKNNAMVTNDPWSPFGEVQGNSSNVLGGNNVPWGLPAQTASTNPAAGTNNNLSTDPFSPMAQKEL